MYSELLLAYYQVYGIDEGLRQRLKNFLKPQTTQQPEVPKPPAEKKNYQVITEPPKTVVHHIRTSAEKLKKSPPPYEVERRPPSMNVYYYGADGTVHRRFTKERQ